MGWLRRTRARTAAGWGALRRAAGWLAARGAMWPAVALVVVLAGMACVAGAVAWGPARWASPWASLGPLGLPQTEVRIVYPTRLSTGQGLAGAQPVTVLARSQAPVAPTAPTVEVWLTLPDEGLAFVDAQGRHIAGRVLVQPGARDAIPQDILVAQDDTQLSRGLLARGRARIEPLAVVAGEELALPDLAGRVRLLGRWGTAYAALADGLERVALPALGVGLLALSGLGIWRRGRRERAARQDRRLGELYTRLRGQITVENWADARVAIEQIRLLAPNYRDVPHLEATVGAAETAASRREQLYVAGVRAYRQRDWPGAVQSFGAIEEETPYYRDVRFLRRTAALYADLQSRDRSLRLAAAEQLGAVADLVDYAPLVAALADRSERVAEAAMAAFRAIGLSALDALLGGLTHEQETVRTRAYQLIEGLGQQARVSLVGALRSSDPTITAAVSRLLVTLGARQELADALLWAEPEHQPGLVAALLGEGPAAYPALVQGLAHAAPARQPVLIDALAALKCQHDLDRRLDESLRATKDPSLRELLQRAAKAPAAPFLARDGARLAEASLAAPADGVQRLRLLGNSSHGKDV